MTTESLTFDRARLEDRLALLARQAQAAFGAACCERLLPNYRAFCREVEFGRYESIQDCLGWIWSALTSDSPDTKQIEQWQQTIEELTPDTEDFDTILVSSALDACTSVLALLSFLKEPRIERIGEIAEFARDTVDMFVQEHEGMDAGDVELEEKIRRHPLMQRELQQQGRDIEFLALSDVLSDETLDRLRALWANRGRSNLDL